MLEGTMTEINDAWTITKEQQDADATEIKVSRLIPDGIYEATLYECSDIAEERLFDSEKAIGAPFVETNWEVYGPERNYRMFGVRMTPKKWTNQFGKVDSSYYNLSTLCKAFGADNAKAALEEARVRRVQVRISSGTKGKKPRNYMTILGVA